MSFQLQTISINSLVKEAINTNKIYAEKFGISLELIEPAAEYWVNADPDRLMQVLTNLISNASKFSPKNETIRISIEIIGTSIRVSISNKGPGIPLQFHSQIFQKFSQGDASTTRDKGGTGLGLNISKNIIEKMGGTLNFTSIPDHYTTFYFDLPQALPPRNIIHTKEHHAETNKKILICEDDESQSNYLKLLLESAGFIVHIAHTATEGRKLLQQSTYQALLLDLILPDQDGISLIRELRSAKDTENLPIIVLSIIAKTGHELSQGDAVSVIDWLDKPIDLNRLLTAINKIDKPIKSLPQILHIEDNPDAQIIMQTLLENHTLVSTANNLREAKELLEKNQYNLVILDLLLPDGNGVEILPLLSKHNVPVIVFSDMKLNKKYSKYVSEALLKSSSSNEALLNTIIKFL